MKSATQNVNGSCLCGAIRLRIDATDRDVVACHCRQCRKQTGHFVAATRAANTALHIEGEQHLRWYSASPEAERGFCQTCGSLLFWRVKGSEHTSIMAGCLDSPTGLKLSHHIYVDDKGDYYELESGLETYPQSD